MEQDYDQNYVIMETRKQISTKLQGGFRNLQIPANLITDSLLTKVGGQYQAYLKRMTIQMAAEDNDILKVLLRDTEDTLNNLWKVAANIDIAADRINNANNSVVGKINVEIAKASKDNDDHVDEVMEYTTDTIVNEINDATRNFEDVLQDSQSLIMETNESNTQLILKSSKLDR
jgi:hypothetical protein